MKTLLSCLCAALLLSVSASGQTVASNQKPATSSATDQTQFTALLQQVATAIQKHDTVWLAANLAPEYRHYTPDGASDRKSELTFVGSKAFPFTSAALASPVEVNNYGNTAVTVATMKFGGIGQNKTPFTSDLHMMTVWVQRNGRWQMALVHSKVMPAKS